RHDVVGAERDPAIDLAWGAHRLLERFDPAQPAAGRPGEVASPLAMPRAARRRQPHAQLDAERSLDHLQALDLVEGGDDSFGQAETVGEILEVLRRRHHDGTGAAVIGEGDGGLLGDCALADGAAVWAPGDARDARKRWRHAATPPPRAARCGGFAAP